MRKKILIPAMAVLLFFSTTAFQNDFFEIAKQIEIFTTVFKELNMNYVDETNPGDLMNTAIKNMLNELDPYTVFMNEQDVEEAMINSVGDYTGIGASVKTLKDKLVIVEPYKGYPADLAGLKAGDEIIKVGDVIVADFTENAGNLLRGAAGSEVRITYRRQDETREVSITRQEVEQKAVPLYRLVDESTGYIALSKFTGTASYEVSNALRLLKADGARQLILDLRGNPGGLLREAIMIVNLFVPKNQLVVTTKSKVDKYNQTYFTQREPIDTEIPIVVLIDGKSASASEIVSGALQDLDRAVVIGTRSFGKGLVQRPKQLTYGTQMKVTISRYYTPSGRCIQALDYWNRDEKGNATRVNRENYTEFKTKNGRSVYDGGGVEPDIDIASSKLSPVTRAIMDDDYIFDYVTQYYYSNEQPELNSFALGDADFADFKSYLNARSFAFETQTERELEKVLAVAMDEKLDDAISVGYRNLISQLSAYKDQAVDKNKEQLLALIENEIIKRYYYREGMYEYYLANNEEIVKATELLANPDKYNSYLKPF